MEKKTVKMKTVQKLTGFLRYKWTVAIYYIILILSSLVLIFVRFESAHISTEQLNALVKWGMVTTITIAVISLIVTYRFRSHIEKLYDTIRAIADGDFVVAVNTQTGDDESIVYKNLSRVAQELRGNQKEIQQFTNEFLHEIKTPITAIHGFADHLIETGRDIEPPERMRFLQLISDESIRLADLSQKSLLLAKLDASQIIPDKQSYDLGEQIKQCTILLFPEIEKKDIEIDIDVEGLRYYGNPEYMEQVWLNLIGNAIKFTPEHGEVAIRGIAGENEVTVSVGDSGPGMDEETRAHVFDKYYQGSSGKKLGGNGIGLSIVHRIVTLCAGSIEITSEVSQGSTFTVTLPTP